MGQQTSLFDDAPKESGSLRLAGGHQRPLRPSQRTFNKLVARIENLRRQLRRETTELNDALAFYGKHLEPRLCRMTGLRKEICRALAPFLANNALKKTDRKALGQIISQELHTVASAEGGLNDPDLNALFERAAGVDFQTARQEDFEDARNMMEGAFEDMGLDVDLSAFDYGMSPADFAESATQLAHDITQRAEQQESSHRKTKKQLNREKQEQQAEALQKKTIASIYKQLARVIHPDFESDPARRQQKEAVMQELTTAYRENDLHTLLRLELEWIQREQNDIDRLTDEKLSIYNQALRDQIRELEFELEDLPMQARYEPLQEFDGLFGIQTRTDGPAQVKEMDYLIHSMEGDLDRFRSSDGIQTVKALIREFRRSRPF